MVQDSIKLRCNELGIFGESAATLPKHKNVGARNLAPTRYLFASLRFYQGLKGFRLALPYGARGSILRRGTCIRKRAPVEPVTFVISSAWHHVLNNNLVERGITRVLPEIGSHVAAGVLPRLDSTSEVNNLCAYALPIITSKRCLRHWICRHGQRYA